MFFSEILKEDYEIVGFTTWRNLVRKIRGNELAPGTIVRCSYKGEYSTDPKPVIFVLNGNYKGKLHGLALNVIGNGGYLRDLKKMTELETKDLIGAVTSYKRLTLSHPLNDPYNFYYSKLRPWVRRFEKDQPYRTYFVKNMSNIEILDYRFAKGYRS